MSYTVTSYAFEEETGDKKTLLTIDTYDEEFDYILKPKPRENSAERKKRQIY